MREKLCLESEQEEECHALGRTDIQTCEVTAIILWKKELAISLPHSPDHHAFWRPDLLGIEEWYHPFKIQNHYLNIVSSATTVYSVK